MQRKVGHVVLQYLFASYISTLAYTGRQWAAYEGQ
jgi:hypothetical protein